MTRNNARLLSANALKIIAVLSMLADHIGYILLPHVPVLRIIGRIAFPFFAFFISEGCLYTKHKLRYLGCVALLGILCQIIYYLAQRSSDMNILITFSVSIITIYSMQYIKCLRDSDNCRTVKKVFGYLLFAVIVALVYLLNMYIEFDYGFWGCMTPVFAYAFIRSCSDCRRTLYNTRIRILIMGIALFGVAVEYGGIQWYSLIALPLLMLYSGSRGRLNLKYFFYIFYPLHFVVLEVINVFIKIVCKA